MVSVIVPNYNHEAYLEQRLQSIFKQTYQPFEVIILDDCSTDNSRAIIEKYRQHANVSQVVFNERNSGSPFLQWQKGIALAKGKWIWIAESDDDCDENLEASLMSRVGEDEGIVLSYCQSSEVDEQGKGWRTMQWHTDKVDKEYWKQDYVNDGQQEIKKCLWYINTIPNASAVVFKKSAYEQADPFFANMKMYGDWALWIEIVKAGKVAFTAAPHNFFRTHQATTRVGEERARQKARLQEEYTIVKAMRLLAVIGFIQSKKRMVNLIRSYSSYHTKNEIKNFIKNPVLYKSNIPLAQLVSIYCIQQAVIKTKKIFSS